MRKLLVLLILGTVLWSGYWFAGSSALRQGAEQWFADQTALGMQAKKTGLSVVGFPNRFDLTVEGLDLADPGSGVRWQAPFLQVFAMTWKPWHIIAALPPRQVIHLPDQEITLTAEGLRASARARPTADLPLAAVIVESGRFAVASSKGQTVGADFAQVAIRAVEGEASSYDLGLDIGNLAPDPALMAMLSADSGLPPTLSVIHLVLRATLTAPLDRNAGEMQPQPSAVEVREALIEWGDLSLTASGGVAPDAKGYAAGRVEFSITNWEKLVPVLVASGAVKLELSQTVQNMLAALAKESGDAAVLKLPLLFKDGRMSLGPLPLGPAPVMGVPAG